MRKILITLLLITGVLMANILPPYKETTLKNGLRVVVIEMDNGSNVITTDIFYRVGSRNEKMGKSGIAHMLEHLNFKSTKNLKAGEFDTIVKSYGGVNNASTSFDYTHYFIKSSSKNLEKSVGLFAELMENLSLKDEEFQPERDVVAEERRWRTDNSPMGFLYFKLFNNAYVYHPYHWTPIGFMNDIRTWTIEDIREFHSTYYQPKNAILIVAGDIKADEVFKVAKEKFEHIKNTKDIPKVHEVEPKQDGAKRVIIHKDSEAQMVAIAYHIPNFKDPDQVALSALSELLSRGKSSILNKELVDKKRLVNTIYAYNMEEIDPGLFLFLAVCNPGVKAEEAEEEILKIIKQIQEGKFSQEEIKKIKTNAKSDFIHSLEVSSSLVNMFGSYMIKGDITPLTNYLENLEKLSKDDIVRVANKYLVPSNSTTIILRKDDK